MGFSFLPSELKMMPFCAEAEAVSELLRKHRIEVEKDAYIADDGSFLFPPASCQRTVYVVHQRTYQPPMDLAFNDLLEFSVVLRPCNLACSMNISIITNNFFLVRAWVSVTTEFWRL